MRAPIVTEEGRFPERPIPCLQVKTSAGVIWSGGLVVRPKKSCSIRE